MLLPGDVLYCIILVTDYKTTKNFLMVNKELFSGKNIWKDKCEKEYPDCLYFDTWSGEVNYKVHLVKRFGIMYEDYGEDKLVHPYLIEYTPSMGFILEMNPCKKLSKMVSFSTKSLQKYMVLTPEDGLYSFNKKQNAKDWINEILLEMGIRYVFLIKTSLITPWFFNQKQPDTNIDDCYELIEYKESGSESE